MDGLTRRAVLRALPGVVAGSAGVSARSARASETDTAFDPTVHAFDFQNWSTTASRYPEHNHESITEEQVRRAIKGRWADAFEATVGVDPGRISDALFDAIARQVYVSANQFSATNGHCYGMIFAAQAYYEHPERIPFGRETASEFTHPAEPLDDPAEPIGEEIDLFQTIQILDPNAWLGRRAIARPDRIDVAREVETVLAVVDRFGTAGITLVDDDTRLSHQVLVYGYERSSSMIRLFVYDPNRPASWYAEGHTPTVDINHRGDTETMESYGRYRTVLYNRRDRQTAVAAGAPETISSETVPKATVEDTFRFVLFLVDSPAVQLATIGPEKRAISRDLSPFMNVDATEYHTMSYRYGAPTGEYRVAVTAAEETTYQLVAKAASTDGELLERTIDATIEEGEIHGYLATLPATGEGGSIERITGAVDWRHVAAGLGATAVGAGARLSRSLE
ncbi:hypothetical protein ACNS7O_08830 [Haloferacaceae archaeon DSL9]